MSTLSFTDPRHVAAYIDRFEDRSISPLQAYLWENADDDEKRIVSRVRREELDMMVIDEEKDTLVIDAAIFTTHQTTDEYQNVLVLSHEQSAEDEQNNLWRTQIVAILQNRIAAENLAKQILGEAALAFSVVE